MNPRNPLAVLRALEDIIVAHPDLRIGQVIVNALSYANNQADLFYVEDNHLANALVLFEMRGK